ncbi:MAG: dihydrofolate reductase [Bacteroidetes bacterium]|nr:MAG: dihydrofolate reductase [Bacteroidota bacterium]
MKIKLIVAYDQEKGIGKNNDLMWNLPRDMRFFKETTEGSVVIMGRKNYDSIPEKYRPLPNRQNIVLSRNQSFEAPGCLTFQSLEKALEYLKETDEQRTVFIIGGGQIYREALVMGVVDEMYITEVDHVFGADTFFPELDLMDWEGEEILRQEVDDKHAYPFRTKHYFKQA